MQHLKFTKEIFFLIRQGNHLKSGNLIQLGIWMVWTGIKGKDEFCSNQGVICANINQKLREILSFNFKVWILIFPTIFIWLYFCSRNPNCAQIKEGKSWIFVRNLIEGRKGKVLNRWDLLWRTRNVPGSIQASCNELQHKTF